MQLKPTPTLCNSRGSTRCNRRGLSPPVLGARRTRRERRPNSRHRSRLSLRSIGCFCGPPAHQHHAGTMLPALMPGGPDLEKRRGEHGTHHKTSKTNGRLRLGGCSCLIEAADVSGSLSLRACRWRNIPLGGGTKPERRMRKSRIMCNVRDAEIQRRMAHCTGRPRCPSGEMCRARQEGGVNCCSMRV